MSPAIEKGARHERQRILARYAIEAPSPAAAAVLGGDAARAEHPSARARGSLSVLERAERGGGDDGWVLYRIVKDPGQEVRPPASTSLDR
jgi:hypothetical protein